MRFGRADGASRDRWFDRYGLPPAALAAEIVENLEAALEQFRGVTTALERTE